MLIPAMAFAWCVVSLPRPADASTTARVARAAATQDSSSPGANAPLEAADDADESGGQATEDRTGDRPPERVQIRGPLPLAVISYAKTLVNLPMGAEQVAEIEGQRYVFVLQRHYHPPGFVGAPNGWHKGVTAFALQ